MQQSQEFPGVNAFFVGNVRQHLDGQRVVRGFGQLHVHLGGLVLSGHHETNRSDELFVADFLVVGKP